MNEPFNLIHAYWDMNYTWRVRLFIKCSQMRAFRASLFLSLSLW